MDGSLDAENAFRTASAAGRLDGPLAEPIGSSPKPASRRSRWPAGRTRPRRPRCPWRGCADELEFSTDGDRSACASSRARCPVGCRSRPPWPATPSATAWSILPTRATPGRSRSASARSSSTASTRCCSRHDATATHRFDRSPAPVQYRFKSWLFAVCVLTWPPPWHAVTYQIAPVAPEVGSRSASDSPGCWSSSPA